MDPVSIAAVAVKIASALFAKDASEAIKKGAVRLWNFIKGQFTSAEDTKVVAEVEKNPGDEKVLEKLISLIEGRVKADKKFSGELEKEIEDAKKIPGMTQTINATKIGAVIQNNSGSFTINN